MMAYDGGIGVFIIGDEDFLDLWRAVPACFAGTIVCDDDYVIKPLTLMFVHGGVIHLVFNMFILSVFEFGLEDQIGKTRFILVYLVSGFAGFGFMVFLDPNNTMGVVGTSGAVLGAMNPWS